MILVAETHEPGEAKMTSKILTENYCHEWISYWRSTLVTGTPGDQAMGSYCRERGITTIIFITSSATNNSLNSINKDIRSNQ